MNKIYEYVAHSMFPKDYNEVEGTEITIGGKDCKKPVTTSVLNIGAMSFGALSGAAVRALNKGAMEGLFLHNTGEGGISKHHLQGGGLIYQIGTGYFGAGITGDDGKRYFDADTFRVNAGMSNKKITNISEEISIGVDDEIHLPVYTEIITVANDIFVGTLQLPTTIVARINLSQLSDLQDVLYIHNERYIKR